MMRVKKFRAWQSIAFVGLWLVLLGGCTTTTFYEGVAQFDPEVVERNVILRTGQKMDGSPMPSPVYSPAEVVQIQLDALQTNNDNDDGIEIVFRFASPRNKRMTGPLRRFSGIIKGPAYRPMLGHQSALLEAPLIGTGEAQQRVRLIDQLGNEIIYLFVLTRQTEATCGRCWMTDLVIVESVTPIQSA
ncbi:MAG: DUF4864 domain-containing protein [Chloroflexota bacterium]